MLVASAASVWPDDMSKYILPSGSQCDAPRGVSARYWQGPELAVTGYALR